MVKTPEQGIINTRQLMWMLFIIFTSFTVLQIPGLLISLAGKDAWLSVIAAWFLDTLSALVTAYMGIRFPGKNYIQYGVTILGKIWGNIFGLLFIIFFLIVSVTVMRGLGMYIGNVFLPRTPPTVVLLCAYIVIAYIVRKGIEVIARLCEILGPVFLLSLAGLFLFVLPFVHFERLKPQFDQGVHPFLCGVPLILSYIGICIAISWYIPLSNRPEKGFLAKFSALSLGTLVICLVVVFSIGIFGVEQAGNMANTGLQLARMIRIADYFERMEVIWIVIVVGAGIMMAANAVWIFCLSIAHMAGLDTYKPLVNSGVLLSFMLCITSFSHNTAYLDFTYYTFPLIGISVLILPLLLFFAALITGKKGKAAS